MSSHVATGTFDDIVNPRTGEQPAPAHRSSSAEGAPGRRSSSAEGAYRDPAAPAPVAASVAASVTAPEAPAATPADQPAPRTTRVFGIDIKLGRGGGPGGRGGGASGRAQKPAPSALVLGAEPRVDLLPPEVKARRATRVLQQRLFAAVIVVALLVAAACGGAWYLRHQAAEQLAAAQARTGALISEQITFTNVSKLEQQTQFVETAQHVAGATDVDWQAYLDRVQASLPSGVTISTLTVDSETPLVAYAQSQSPLQGPRVATITFTAMSQQLPDVPVWLNALSKLPGYADANPDTVALSSGKYSATITMHVTAAVFDNRFAPKGSK